jgi:hypothetical protein
MSTGKLITILSVGGALAIGLACFFIFRSGKPDDPIKAQLDAAKSTHSQSIAAANTALVAAFDAEVKTLQSSGNADGAAAVTSQKAEFTSSDVLPQTPYMKDAVTQYQQASKAADDGLVAAYNDAIAGFDAESKSDLADAARGERTDLVSKIASSNNAGPAAPVSTIAQELDAAKAANKQAIADARKVLVTTVDDRLNAATDAGDLATVQSLQAVKSAAQTDGSVSDDVKDAAIVAAKKRYDQAVVAANGVLAQAYQKAVRDYTKARQIDQAMATQKELTDSGIDRGAAPSPKSVSVSVVQFVSAEYGDGARVIDVSEKISELYKTNSIILIAGLPDPAPGVPKKLTAHFKIGQETFVLSGLDGKTISIAASAEPKGANSVQIDDHVKLDSAFYGVDRRIVDVRDSFASRLKSGQSVPISAETFGISDPAFGVKKSLAVRLQIDGTLFDLSADDGGAILLGGSDSATAGGGRVIDLLALIDPHRDAVMGTWTKDDAGLQCYSPDAARLRIPYLPPQEYDYEIDFIRKAGNQSVNQILARGDVRWFWSMGAYADRFVGFSDVKGLGVDKNVTTIEMPGLIKNGELMRSLIQVRNDHIAAYVNGKLIEEYKTDYSDLTPGSQWNVGAAQLGVGEYRGPTVFQAIKVTEITGTGQTTVKPKAEP